MPHILCAFGPDVEYEIKRVVWFILGFHMLKFMRRRDFLLATGALLTKRIHADEARTRARDLGLMPGVFDTEP